MAESASAWVPFPGETRDPAVYNVGWICALEVEVSIALEFLDSEHQLPKALATDQVNSYVLGTIGDQEVVMIGPSSTSSSSTPATIAVRVKHMLDRFPNIRVVLSVGIGGGVPTYRDIRLGDVVIGVPKEGHGGVVEFDFDASVEKRAFQRIDTFHAPPRPLLVTIALHSPDPGLLSRNHIHQSITRLLYTKPRLRDRYSRPDPETDVLFDAGTVHSDHQTCRDHCRKAPGSVISHRSRDVPPDSCAFHYGTIASSMGRMTDAALRDRLAAKHDALCFENETAGLMDRVPFLAIRGISDYSDSHSTEEWQGFAAVAAAAYAEFLLRFTSRHLIDREMRVSDMISPGVSIPREYFLFRKQLVKPSRIDDNSPGMLLHHAIDVRDVQKAKRLLQEGANASIRLLGNKWNMRPEPPLLRAVKAGDVEMIRLLLEQPHLDINGQDHLRRTALTLAVINGQGAAVELLARAALDRNSSAVNLVALREIPEDLMLFLWNDYHDYNYQAILTAIKTRQETILDVLLRNHMTRNMHRNQLGKLLRAAVVTGQVHLVRQLLGVGGNMPINSALLLEKEPIRDVAFTLRHPSTLESDQASYRPTAIELAAGEGYSDIVMLLLEQENIRLSSELSELKRDCQDNDLDLHLILPHVMRVVNRDGPWIAQRSNFILVQNRPEYRNRLLQMARDGGIQGTDILNHDEETRIEVQRHVASYCGLGGVNPPVTRDSLRGKEVRVTGREARIQFNITDGYHGIFYRTIEVGNNVRDAMALLRAAGFYDEEITFLTCRPSVKGGEEGQREAKIVDMRSVKVSDMNKFLYKVTRVTLGDSDSKASDDDMEVTAGKMREFRVILNTIFQTILPEFKVPSDKDEILHACVLLAQVLSLGVVLFSRAHVGDLRLEYLSEPLEKITLLGHKSTPDSPHVIAEQVSLGCMGDMIGAKVFCFRLGDQVLPPGPYMLRATCQQIADCWGPATLLRQDESDEAFGLLIRGALIEPTERFTDQFPLCHWGRELKSGDSLSIKFNRHTPILVGAHTSTQSNATTASVTLPFRQTTQLQPIGIHHPTSACPRSPQESFLKSESQMVDLGTCPTRWKFTERQAVLRSGLHASLELGFAQTKQSGVPLKAVILDRWQRDGNLSLLERQVAVHISVCTGVAERISLRELFNSCLGGYIPTISIPGCDDAFKSSAVRAMSTEQEFAAWTAGLNAQEKGWLEMIVDKLFACLKETGSLLDEEVFSVLWPEPRRHGSQIVDVGSCVRVDATERPQGWLMALKDTDLCATFAAMTDTCLENHLFFCRRDVKAAWMCANMVSTSVSLNQVGKIVQASDKPSLPVEHNRSYWIGDTLFVADTKTANNQIILRSKSVPKQLLTQVISAVWSKVPFLRESRHEAGQTEKVYLTSRKG